LLTLENRSILCHLNQRNFWRQNGSQKRSKRDEGEQKARHAIAIIMRRIEQAKANTPGAVVRPISIEKVEETVNQAAQRISDETSRAQGLN
jgi:hypothetical protein